MSIATRLKQTCAVLLFASSTLPAAALEMFCPRSGILLGAPTTDRTSASVELNLLASRGEPDSFPRRATDLASKAADTYPISLKLTDCSNKEYQCKRATFATSAGKPQEFLLVLPREIAPGREYTYRDVHMVVRLSEYSSPANVRAAQVTLWQLVGDTQLVMELTVQPGRGVLFWDGVKFFPDQEGPGELCALTSDNGFFRGTRVLLN